MRYTLAIGIFLIILGAILAFTMRKEPYDPMAFNPEDVAISAELSNEHGNVIWISLEGVRPDHMGTYGYGNITTPSIDSFASESIVFERCYAQSTETYRSMATMLTSQYPSAYPSGSQNVATKGFRDLLSQPSSLVENIRGNGLTTAAIVGSPVLKSAFGFGTGFDYYDDKPVVEEDNSFRPRNSSDIFNSTSSWLSRNFNRPFFLLVHFPDPRGPYEPNPEYLKQLNKMQSYSDSRMLEVANQDVRPIHALPAYFGEAGEKKNVGELKRLYDGEIAEVDYYIGELLDSVSRLGISDETMIIISGAHGESLDEHGYYFSNGGTPYRCLTQIPLIIHDPYGSAGRVKDVVEGIDIMPTILSYLKIEKSKSLAGMNLLRFYEKSSMKHEFPAFSCWDDPKVTSVIKGNYELLCFDDKEFKLYQIINDPSEIYDLYTENDPTAQQLKMLLDAWNRQNREKALENEIIQKYGPPGRKIPMVLPKEQFGPAPK